MIPLLINQSNDSLDFPLQLSKCLADSDLVVIGLTGIGPIRKISVLDWFLPGGGDASLHTARFYEIYNRPPEVDLSFK